MQHTVIVREVKQLNDKETTIARDAFRHLPPGMFWSGRCGGISVPQAVAGLECAQSAQTPGQNCSPPALEDEMWLDILVTSSTPHSMIVWRNDPERAKPNDMQGKKRRK